MSANQSLTCLGCDDPDNTSRRKERLTTNKIWTLAARGRFLISLFLFFSEHHRRYRACVRQSNRIRGKKRKSIFMLLDICERKLSLLSFAGRWLFASLGVRDGESTISGRVQICDSLLGKRVVPFSVPPSCLPVEKIAPHPSLPVFHHREFP